MATTFYLEAFRDGGWTLVGQYPNRQTAEDIARDYRSRGERVRIVTES